MALQNVLICVATFVMILGTSDKVFAQQPVEADKRLHSDGKGWKLNQSPRGKDDLPRILLIGDSILSGYGKYVVAEFENRASVDYWVQPYHQGHMQGTYLSSMIKEVLAHGPYDVITFNLGLHGWQEGRIPNGKFMPLTTKLVQCLRENNPNAKLYWVSTTQITQKKSSDNDKSLGVDAKLNPIIEEHNRMAAKVMQKENVPVIDFYGLMLPHLNWARGDQFHWTTPAYRLMAQTLSKEIAGDLPNAK